MIRPQILNLKDKKDLIKVSTKFSGLVGRQQLGQTLIIVDGPADQVLTSKDLEKIIAKARLKENTNYTLLTTNLTVEAGEMIKSKGINLLQLKGFFWTDESLSQREKSSYEFWELRKQQIHDEKIKEEERELGNNAQQSL
jgi:hypothetical protein